jgi:hypothetical protein
MKPEEAIKTIESAKRFAYDDIYEEAFNTAIEALKTDIDIQDAYEQGYACGWKERFGEPQQWIPCSERLPSYSERIVLATVVRRDKTWNNEPYHRLVTYTNGKWYPVPQSINLVPCRMATIEQSDGGQAEVIAWMPLPEPYKEEGEEK